METSNLTFAQNLFQWGEYIGGLFNPSFSSSFVAKINLETFWNAIHKITTFPQWYRTWWISLAKTDPVHVFIETALIAFVIYLLAFTEINNSGAGRNKKKKKDGSSSDIDLLTEAEKEELVRDWKPAPLVPPQDHANRTDNGIVVHKVDGTQLMIQDKFCSSLGSSSSPSMRTVLNMASHDFLGLGSSEPSIKDISKAALITYGCGSCGPRGFYGTIDVHLDLEKKISQFCRTDDAIMYSDGASAATSTVAAFAKRGDLLIVDEGVYEALQTGVTLSRANVVYFKHNDMVRPLAD